MKQPKIILSCCLLLFACLFLFLAPNLTKPANAQYSAVMDPVQPSDWSGDVVTFHWDNPAVADVALIIVDIDDPLKPAVYNSNVQGLSSLTVNTADWNIAVHPPDGQFKVILVWILTEVSNPITFTIPGGGFPPPPGGDYCARVWGSLPFGLVTEKIVKCKIQKQIYDDKATTANILWGFLDGAAHLVTGESELYPEINGITKDMGALTSASTMVAAVYSHPPVSGMDYLASQFIKFNPASPVYAATEDGIGFNALRPVQNIWESFRNIAYIGFVLVFVIIGFMIMFRAHISPQAVATVQDSLPRIVIALFMVTFSYAIAGFMIDAMFLLLNVIITALPGELESKQYVFKQSVFGAIWGSWGDIFGTVNKAVGDILKDTVKFDYLDKIIGGFGGILSSLVVGIALLFVMFKVFIMLLTAYAYIVILTITAPFFFLAQALPGNNGGQTWFKQMAANIAVFPVVAIMFIFAGILGGIKTLGGTAQAAVESGTVGNFPLLSGDISTEAVGKLIAIGILLTTPSAAELIKNAIGAKGLQGGGGAGAALAAGAAVLGAGPSAIARSAAPRAGAEIAKRTPILGRLYKDKPLSTGSGPAGGTT